MVSRLDSAGLAFEYQTAPGRSVVAWRLHITPADDADLLEVSFTGGWGRDGG